MKKIKYLLPALLVMLVAAVFVACDGGGEKKTEFYLNETATAGKVEMTALQVKESQGDELFNIPKEGELFVGVKFKLTNKTGKDYSFSTLLQLTIYYGDTKVDENIWGSSLFGSLIGGEVSDSKSLEGWYILPLPTDWTEVTIEFKPDWLKSEKVTFILKKTDVA